MQLQVFLNMHMNSVRKINVRKLTVSPMSIGVKGKRFVWRLSLQSHDIDMVSINTGFSYNYYSCTNTT